MSAAPETNEWPSDDVGRIAHAFGDASRKRAIRELAKRVEANEDELVRLRGVLDEIARYTRESPTTYVHILASTRGKVET